MIFEIEIWFYKIKGVITRLDELLSQIRRDQESSYSDDQISKKSTLDSDVKRCEMFLCTPVINDKKDENFLALASTHLLSCVLVQMKESATAKSELVSWWKKFGPHTHNELENITLFEKTYSSDKAIYWYGKDSFIYKVLNRTLRFQETNTIFLFQFFIRDIHQQLAQIQCKHHIKVYRGKSMDKNDLYRFEESVGGLITMNSILSTSRKRQVALEFLRRAHDSKNSDIERVLFTIDAEPQAMTTKPFANISKLSEFPDDDEVLFAYGCFFRVIDVQQNPDQIWIVRMMLCGDNDDDVREVLTGIRERFGSSEGEGALFAFIRVLCAMEKFHEAEKYCERLLQQFSSDESALAIVYGELAKIALNKNDSALHAQWNKELMKIQKKVGSNYADNSTAIGNSNSKIITAKTQHG